MGFFWLSLDLFFYFYFWMSFLSLEKFSLLMDFVKNIIPTQINLKMFVIGGIKYNQIHHHLIDWFEKIHPFLNMLVLHLTPFGAH
jgi:hypothetical protein